MRSGEMDEVIDYWEICYVAKYKNGQLVDEESPFTTANVIAKDKFLCFFFSFAVILKNVINISDWNTASINGIIELLYKDIVPYSPFIRYK